MVPLVRSLSCIFSLGLTEACGRPSIISIISALDARQYVQFTRLLETEIPQLVQLNIIGKYLVENIMVHFVSTGLIGG